jgi:hypothetical protein
VISAPGHKEEYPTAMKEWDAHDVSSYRFQEEEFKIWSENYFLEDIGNVNPESDEPVGALYWTGGVPYELDLLWKQPMKTLTEKTKLYREKRVREMMLGHSKFCDKLEEQCIRNLKECISRMVFCISPSEITVGMDLQLLDIVSDQNGHKTITAFLVVRCCGIMVKSLWHLLGLSLNLFERKRLSQHHQG